MENPKNDHEILEVLGLSDEATEATNEETK
jgi:hypothetical protein